jgi:hypothetical protein
VRFKNYQPITGQKGSCAPEHHYFAVTGHQQQNRAHLPDHLRDVTNVAANKQQLQTVNQQLQHLSRTDRLDRPK